MMTIERFLQEIGPLTLGAEAPLRVRDYFQAAIPQGVDLPGRFTEPDGTQYARHLLARFSSGATAIVMVWGKGQGTPIHDHGMWCVEGVFRGKIEVVRYDLVGEADVQGGPVRLRAAETIHASVGEAGALIPPSDYHTIQNMLATPSVTVHIYGGEMDRAKIFIPEGGGRYRMEEQPLQYTTSAPLLG